MGDAHTPRRLRIVRDGGGGGAGGTGNAGAVGILVDEVVDVLQACAGEGSFGCIHASGLIY